jgi:hypothetical protein
MTTWRWCGNPPPSIVLPGICSVISADRMIDGRMMETGFNPATFDQSGLGVVPSREPVEMLVVEKVK